jgi:hypothetical protein
MRNLVLALITALLAAAPSRDAAACVCFFETIDERGDRQVTEEVRTELRRAVAVFVGEVIARDTLTVTFDLERVWKGELEKKLTMSTGAVANADGTVSISSCDYSFTLGEKYLVFAYGRSLTDMRASQCTHTAPLKQATATIEHLRKIVKEGRRWMLQSGF